MERVRDDLGFQASRRRLLFLSDDALLDGHTFQGMAKILCRSFVALFVHMS